MNKKSRKFIKVLARKLIKDQDHLKKKSLRKAFEKAVNGLPESELQSTLLSNFTDAFAILRSQIEKLKVLTEPLAADNVQTINGEPDLSASTPSLPNGHSEKKTINEIERTKISDHHFNFPYNFYIKKNVLIPTASKTAVDQFYLKLLQNQTGIASVIKDIKEYQRRKNEKSILSTLNHLLIISTGIKDKSFIKKLLYVYLVKMQPLVEKYIEEDSVKKASNLQENLHKFLYVSHLRYFSSDPQDDVIEEKPYYNDLIASLLSLYLDISVYLFRNEERKEKLAKFLYNFISYILVKTPQYKYDVLLQITQVNEDRVQLILPLVKFCLTDCIDKTDIKSYVKYIITVAMVNNLNLPDSFNIDDDIKKARSVVAPTGTIDWLKERVSAEVLNLDELNNDNLSFYLVDNMTESLHSILIDSLCDKEGLELNDDDEDSSIKDTAQEDEVIAFQPDLSGFFNQDKTSQDADADMESLFLIDRSGSSKKTKNNQAQSQQSNNVSKSMENLTLSKASPSKLTNQKKILPVRKIAVISPNSHDECEPNPEELPDIHKENHKDELQVLKKKVDDCNDVSIERDDDVKFNHKKQKTMQTKGTENSSLLELKDLKDSKEIAEDVAEKKTSYLVPLSSPQSKNEPVSPDSSKSPKSASPVTTPKSSKKPTKAAKSPVKKTPIKAEQIMSTDHHFLRSPVTPHKHCLCEDTEEKTPRSLRKKGDLKSPIVSPTTTSHTTPKVKSPKTSKSPKSEEEHPHKETRTPRSVKKDVIDISDPDEDVAIVNVTPGDKKSHHAIADWKTSTMAGSVVSDSENTDVEMTPRKTRRRNTNIPDLSVHLTSNVRKASGNESSSKKTNVEPIEPEPDIIHVCSSSKEFSSDSTVTPEKLRRQNKSSKSASDSDIIEMSGTPNKVTSSAKTPGRASRRKSRSIAATPKTEAAPSSTQASTKRPRKPNAATDASDDFSASESDSEPGASKLKSKRLSGQEMKAVLDQSGTKPESSGLSTVRSPISLRNRPAVSSTTPSISKSRKVASDSEVCIESRMRTRRMSESSVEDLMVPASNDVTPSKMRKKDKTAVILDPISESPTKSPKKSQSTTSDTPKKYSLRNR